jgi:hypothetical protein
MIVLDTTTRTLEIILSSTVTANQMPVSVTYVDQTTTAYSPASSNTATNNTTAVTIVSAPAASTQRVIKLINIYNADTSSNVITVRLNDNSTLVNIIVSTLTFGDTLQFTDLTGWRQLNNNGQIKEGGGTDLIDQEARERSWFRV